jgi:hypothetical protein
MSTPSLVVATPVYGGAHPLFVRSLLDLQRAMDARGIPFRWETIGDSLVSRARNNLVARLLDEPGWTHLLFADADEAFRPESVARLLEVDLEIVGAAVPLKHLDWGRVAAAAASGITDPAALATAATGLVGHPLPGASIEHRNGVPVVEMARIGCGFMMIRRTVFERMRDHFGEALAYARDAHGGSDYPATRYAFFRTVNESRTEHPEDFSFCERWRQMGGRIFMLPGETVLHIGEQVFGAVPQAQQPSMTVTGPRPAAPLNRRAPCPCGSGKRWNACHGAEQDAAE